MILLDVSGFERIVFLSYWISVFTVNVCQKCLETTNSCGNMLFSWSYSRLELVHRIEEHRAFKEIGSPLFWDVIKNGITLARPSLTLTLPLPDKKSQQKYLTAVVAKEHKGHFVTGFM